MDSEEGSRTSRLISATAGLREHRNSFNLTKTLRNDNENDDLLDLELMLKKTWNIYGVSVMFNFNPNDAVQLKQYAKKLREEVASMLSKEDVSYEARIVVLDVQRPKETDHPIIEINVLAQVRNQERESNVYTGYLVSWNSEPLESFSGKATRLPLLLCRGTPNTMRAVHATLGRMFDCLCVALPATPEDLAWLLPIFLSPGGGQDTAKNTEEIKLEFVVPFLPTAGTINVKFLAKDLINMWKCIFDKKDKIVAEEVDKFMEVIKMQIKELGSLELGLCILNRLQLPSIAISGSKIKVSNIETMNALLMYFNEQAMEALHFAAQLSTSK